MPNQGQDRGGCISGCLKGQEVTPECELLLEGDGDDLETRFRNCAKNPNHHNFFSCSKFKVDDLPPENRTRRMMDEIFQRCVQTVRVKVQFVSPNRPDTFADSEKPYPFSIYKGSDRLVRYGTGKVIEVFYSQGVEGNLCPCPLCKESTRPKKYWWIRVRTATHVIYDRSEAECASFECFLDDVDDVEENKVRTIYGYDTFNIASTSDNIYRSDVCDVLCVTHESDVASLLYAHVPMDYDFLHQPCISKAYAPSKVIVSHPHGRFKRITLGTVLHLTAPINQNYPTNTPLPFKDGTLYRHSVCTRSRKSSFHTCGAETQGGYPFCNSGEKATMETKRCAMEKNMQSDQLPVSFKSNDNNWDITDNFITTEQYNMKEKLEAIKNKLWNANTFVTSDIEEKNEVKNTGDDDKGEKLVKADYIAEFYRIFIREQALMLFVIISFVRQKIKNTRTESAKQQMEQAIQELYDVFLDKNVNTPRGNANPETPRVTNPKKDTEIGVSLSNQGLECLDNILFKSEMGSFNKDNEETKSTFKHDHDKSTLWFDMWHQLLDTCETEFAQLKSKANRLTEHSSSTQSRNLSFFSSVFFGIDEIVDYVLLETKQRQKNFHENVLPLIFEQVFTYSVKEINKLENERCSETNRNEMKGSCSEIPHNIKEIDRNRGEDAVQDNVQRETNAGSGTKEITRAMTPLQKETKGVTDTKHGDHKVDEIPPNNDNAEELNVPVGSTFTLPSDAEYAFRVYSHLPGWISFHPGTTMTTPDGETVQIGEPLFEFKVDFFVPEQSYVTYDIATCPGSSGATVFCDNAFGKNVTPFFPHSGHLEGGGLNRSGIRLNVFSLYSKLIASDSNEIMQCLMKDDTKSRQVPSLIEVSKLLVMKMKGIFMKSVHKKV